MSDMNTIPMRTLSRETARVLNELPAHPDGMIVSRDGEDYARITLLSPLEIAMRQQLRAAGVDPDAPVPPPDPSLRPAPAVQATTASEYLRADRDS